MTYDNRGVSPLKIKTSPNKIDNGDILLEAFADKTHAKGLPKDMKLFTEKQIKEMGHDLSDYTVVVTKGGTKYYAKKSKSATKSKDKFKQLKHPKMPMKD
jgi:hypothetical protein